MNGPDLAVILSAPDSMAARDRVPDAMPDDPPATRQLVMEQRGAAPLYAQAAKTARAIATWLEDHVRPTDDANAPTVQQLVAALRESIAAIEARLEAGDIEAQRRE